MLDNRQAIKPISYFKIKSGKPVSRELESIDAIVLHQMGTSFDVTQRQIKINGSLENAVKVRVAKVKAHFAVINQWPEFVYNNDAALYMESANGLNSRSVSIEIEGNYPISSNDRLSQSLADKAISAMRFIKSQCPNMKYVFAHRQSYFNRVRDPGQEIWQKVALKSGLQIEPNFTVGSGNPIPSNWLDSASDKLSDILVEPNTNQLLLILVGIILLK